MTIEDFEKHVPTEALAEGFSYYRVGVLNDVVETSKGQWDTSVRGPNYAVHIEIKNGNVVKTSCTCPEKAEYCECIAATLYTIRDGLYDPNNPALKGPAKTKPAKPPRENFNDLVAKVPEDKIREFIISYAAEDKIFKNVFHTRFIEHSALQGRQHYEEIINRSLKTLARTDYRYKDIRKAVKPVEELLDQGGHAVNRQDNDQAVSICLAVTGVLHIFAETVMRGDSEGGTGDCIQEAFKMLTFIGETQLPTKYREKFFETLLAEASRESYWRNWYMDEWKKVLTTVASTPAMEEKIEELMKASHHRR